MQVFKVHLSYRRLGINYGLPCFFVDLGPGVRYDAIELVKKLREVGLDIGRWVVVRGNLSREKGSLTFIEALKACRVKVEVEDDGQSISPTWFPLVDRWIVDFVEPHNFNYDAMRPMRDILVYRGNNIAGFAEASKKLQALKAVVVDDPKWAFNLVKDYDIRVYQKEVQQ